jgi:hypothetical protein
MPGVWHGRARVQRSSKPLQTGGLTCETVNRRAPICTRFPLCRPGFHAKHPDRARLALDYLASAAFREMQHLQGFLQSGVYFLNPSYRGPSRAHKMPCGITRRVPPRRAPAAPSAACPPPVVAAPPRPSGPPRRLPGGLGGSVVPARRIVRLAGAAIGRARPRRVIAGGAGAVTLGLPGFAAGLA